MDWTLTAVVSTWTISTVLVLLFLYLYYEEREQYLAVWLGAWVMYNLRFVFRLLILLMGESDWFWLAGQFSSVSSAVLLLWGTFIFSRRRMSLIWLAGAAASYLWLIAAGPLEVNFFWQTLPEYTFIGAVYLWTGKVLLGYREFSQLGRRITGWAFIVCGIHKLDYPFVRPLVWLAPGGYLLSAFLHLMMGLGLVLCFFERAKSELTKSKRRYRRILEDQTDFIIRVLPDGTITFVNDAFSRWKQKPINELEGRSVFDLTTKEVADELKKRYQYLTPDNQLSSWDLRGKGGDGALRWMHWTDRGVFDSEGNLLEIQSVGRDIEEKKRSELEMARLATAIEQATETVLIMDLEGKILYANPAFEKTSGYKAEEIIGHRPDFLVEGFRDNENPIEKIGTILLSEGHWQGRVTSIRKDGSTYKKDAVVTPVKDEKGNFTGVVSIGRDVTREIEMEQQLIQSQKMEAVGRLAGGVAHDFNNLLNVINGNAELCRMKLDEDDPLQEQIKGIIRTTDSATLLTRQLLSFSRKQELNVETVDLNQVIMEMKKILQPLVGSKIELKFELADNLDKIEADRSQVEQIVLNLVVNARDAVERDGVIVIKTEKMDILSDEFPGAPQGGSRVMLTVSDNGPGIPAEMTERIFEPFYTTKEYNKGTGLGLSTVQGIVKQHGGTIMVESEPGKGAVFRIEFPAGGKQAAEA